MFYVKSNDRVTVLKRDNIYSRCHECDKEIQYDFVRLGKISVDNVLDVLVLCDACSKKYIHHYPDRTPPTLKTIKFLVGEALDRGYDEDVAFVYNNCEITSLEELDRRDYEDVTADLLAILAGRLNERYGKKGSGRYGQT